MTKWIYDWPQIIRDLQADAYTEAGKRDVLKAAHEWVTCACGNLCEEIPRDLCGAPKDTYLTNTEVNFATAIRGLCKATTVREREINAISARYYLYRIDVIAAEILEGKR